jgi:hypothetical protein
MKKNVAIILIIVAVVLCTCPSLIFGGINFYTASSPAVAATMSALGAQTMGATPPAPVDSTTGMIGGACTICIGILIPVVVALVTLRMARKKEAAESLPPQ